MNIVAVQIQHVPGFPGHVEFIDRESPEVMRRKAVALAQKHAITSGTWATVYYPERHDGQVVTVKMLTTDVFYR